MLRSLSCLLAAVAVTTTSAITFDASGSSSEEQYMGTVQAPKSEASTTSTSGSESTSTHVQYSIRNGDTTSKGVNLGSWLVAEYWMTSSADFWTGAVNASHGEYTAIAEATDPDAIRSHFDYHHSTFINESDIAEIAAVGINTVRVPIGYWIVGFDDNDPSGKAEWKVYTNGTLKYLDLLITDWAKKYNVAVLLSIHAAKGSQNGADNSSPSVYGSEFWAEFAENVNNTISMVSYLADRYKDEEAFISPIVMAQHVARATQTWQPQRYLKFQRQRLRPALELLARVSELPTDDAVEIVDLGAGTGNMAPSFLKRWPNAHVTFVDSSASMLEVAQREHQANEALDTQRFAYVQADFETYEPERPVDLIFSNAALQWVNAEKHKEILPRLYSFLKPGGVLAFQIPDTRLQPSHQRMVDAAALLGLSDRVAGVRWVTCEKDPSFYYELFKTVDSSMELDMWAAVYAQVLEGDNPVANFTGSTALRPYMEALGEPSEDATKFEETYRDMIATAYPKQSDGNTIFNLKRFFVMATKPQ